MMPWLAHCLNVTATPGPARQPYAIDYGKFFFGLFLITIAYFIMADPAFAQAGGGGGGFRCVDGHSEGTLYDAAMECPTTMKMSNVFSFLVCNMERLAGNLLGEMYCGIMVDLIPGVIGMLTLATLFFGIGFTMGVIPATARDFQMFLLKIVCIFVFATQADIIIGVGYNLLITGLREGTAIGISVMYPDDVKSAGGTVTGIDVYRFLDRFLAQAMHFATDYVGAKWDEDNNPCQNAVFAVMAIMAVAFPPVFFIGVMIIFRVCITFLRAIFGYLYSIVGIVFLLTLSPFFLSFYLFKQTRPFFDKWVGYLVTFSLQMVILFAFLGFILSIDVKHISGSLVDIIMPVKENLESTTMRAPWQYCTICDFKVVDKDGNDVKDDQYGKGIITEEGKLVCKDPKTPIRILSASAAPKGSKDADAGGVDSKEVQGALMKFAAFGLVSLLLLAYLVEYLLNYVAALASFLAGGMGASYAPQLGGGQVIGQKISMDMPGGDLADTFERGFTAGYTKDMGKTSIYSTAEGFKEAASWLVTGGPNPNRDPGLVTTFTNFIMNPNRDPYGH